MTQATHQARSFPSMVIDQARNVDLVHLAGTLGLRVNTRGQGGVKVQCPNHDAHAQDDGNPSAHVYKQGSKANYPHIHCFACGWKGDAIKLVMDTLGVDFVQAVKHLTGDVQTPLPVRPAPAAPSVPAPTRDWARLAERAAELLWTNDPAGLYVVDRGLAPVAERYKLGYNPPYTNKEGKPSMYGDRLTIPHYRADGTVPYIKYRLLRDGPGEARYLNTANVSIEPYLWHEALPVALDRGYIFVCEGEIDALSVKAALTEAGDPDFPVIGLPGASSLRADLDVEFTGLRVILIMDSDTAGEQAAEAYRARLGQYCEVVEYPALEGDMNDTLRFLGHEQTAEYVRSMLDWRPARRRVL